MGLYYNLTSASTSIAMIGALLSFAGVGLLILFFSEGMFHGLSKLIYLFIYVLSLKKYPNYMHFKNVF